MFATQQLNRGVVAESSPALLIEEDLPDDLACYCYEDSSYDNVWWLGLGYTSLYNHDPDPNAEFNLIMYGDRPMIEIVALRRIKRGEEITIDYSGEGKTWDEIQEEANPWPTEVKDAPASYTVPGGNGHVG